MVIAPLAKKALMGERKFFSLRITIAGPNFPQIMEFRDKLVEKVGVKLIVGTVHET